MKTTIEVNGYEIVIEEIDGLITVSAAKDGDVIEEFEIQSGAQVQGDEFTEETEAGEDFGGEEVQDFEEFGSEENDENDEEDAQELGDSDDDEDDDDEIEEDEEKNEGKLESFQSFLKKRN